MTKGRSEFIYRLVGVIHNQKRQDVKDRLGYKLEVKIESKSHIKKIRVWQDRLKNPLIWEVIEQGNYVGKRYCLLCRNHMGHYFLVDWKELTSSFAPKSSEKELNNEK